MGYAARVKRKRACRHNCLLKVERTAAEQVEHQVKGHPLKEPEPFVVGPVFAAKYDPKPRKPQGSRQRRVAHRNLARAKAVATFGEPSLA